jgi:hypothetical protein
MQSLAGDARVRPGATPAARARGRLRTRLGRCRRRQYGDRKTGYYDWERTANQLNSPSGPIDARGQLSAHASPSPPTRRACHHHSDRGPAQPRITATPSAPCAVLPLRRRQIATHPSLAAPRSVGTRSRFPGRCAGLSDRSRSQDSALGHETVYAGWARRWPSCQYRQSVGSSRPWLGYDRVPERRGAFHSSVVSCPG